MEIRVEFLFEDEGGMDAAIITDGALIPNVGDRVALESGAWKVKERYYGLKESPVTVRLMLKR